MILDRLLKKRKHYEKTVQEPIRETIEEKIFKLNENSVCTCILCCKDIRIKDILYGKTLFDSETSEYFDVEYWDTLCDLKPLSGNNFYRKYIDSSDMKVIEYDENGIPSLVFGKVKNSDKNEEIEASERFCPFCHILLPEGFATDRVIRIAVAGNMRSGKTSYIFTATEYMIRNQIIKGDYRVQLMEICKEDYQRMINARKESSVMPPTYAHQNSNPGFNYLVNPIIMHIIPTDSRYQPFFLFFMDFFGVPFLSCMRRSYFSEHFKYIDHLIMMIDVHQIVKLKRSDNNDISIYGEYCDCDLQSIIDGLELLKYQTGDNLRSLQCIISKIDMLTWKEFENEDGTIYLKTCNKAEWPELDEGLQKSIRRIIEKGLKEQGYRDMEDLINQMKEAIDYNRELKTDYFYVATKNPSLIYEEKTITDEDLFFEFENLFPEKKMTKNIPEKKWMKKEADEIDYIEPLNVEKPIDNIMYWDSLIPSRKDQKR